MLIEFSYWAKTSHTTTAQKSDIKNKFKELFLEYYFWIYVKGNNFYLNYIYHPIK